MRVTLKDIANELNLSVNTVSRGLRNMDDISLPTRMLIQETAQLLGYQRNLAASSLRTKRSYSIGIIITDYSNPVMSEIIDGAEAVGRKHGYTMMIGASNENAAIEEEIVGRMLEQGVDGLILVPTLLNPDLLHKLDQSQKPYVLAARKYPDCLCNFVCCDDLVGARLVADAFYAKGHQSFLYVAASHNSAVSRDRLQGFSSRLSLFGISHDNIHTLETDATREGAFQKMRSWIQVKQQDHVLPVTAIFAFSDYVACGVYAALKEFGYQIPEDVSVIGFDNNEFSTIIEPPLTSVDNHFFEIGQRSAQRMLDILDLPENERMRSPQGIITMPELVWRNSVADLSGGE